MIKHKACATCKEPFHLYKPYYTIRTRKTIGDIPAGWGDEIALCPDCFRAYKDFLTARTVEMNHKQNLLNMKGATNHES